MSIVLNESEWAKEMISSRSLGKKPFETLSRIARYYLDNKYSKRDVRRLLDSFLLQCNPTASLPKWSKLLDDALEYAVKREAVNIEYIPITIDELRFIDQLNGRQIRRLAFTLLCLSKYWDIVNHSDKHWVNTKDSEIMRIANINTSIKRQSIMYRILRESGFLRFSKMVDVTSVQICLAGKEDTALRISDFRNLGYQYLRYCGEPFFECQNCGITTKYSNVTHGRKQKYCKECAVEVAMRQSVNSVMRLRNKKRLGKSDENEDVVMASGEDVAV